MNKSSDVSDQSDDEKLQKTTKYSSVLSDASQIAERLMELGQFEAATETLQQAIDLGLAIETSHKPEHDLSFGQIFHLLSECILEIENDDTALMYMSESMRVLERPENKDGETFDYMRARAIVRRGIGLVALGQFERALAAFANALQKFPASFVPDARRNHLDADEISKFAGLCLIALRGKCFE